MLGWGGRLEPWAEVSGTVTVFFFGWCSRGGEDEAGGGSVLVVTAAAATAGGTTVPGEIASSFAKPISKSLSIILSPGKGGEREEDSMFERLLLWCKILLSEASLSLSAMDAADGECVSSADWLLR